MIPTRRTLVSFRLAVPLRSFVLLAALIGAILVVPGCQDSRVTKDRFDRVKQGMTVAEVRGILGEGTDVTAKGGEMVAAGAMVEKKSNRQTFEWRDGRKLISVEFENGKVTHKVADGL